MSTTPAIPQDQVDQYHDEGYMILEAVIPQDMLQMLREECSYFLGYTDAKMDTEGVERQGINYGRNRYFISNRYHVSTRMWQFVYGDLMAEAASATLGPDVYLFHEQWVVKAAEKGDSFSWHQDSGYVKFGDHKTAHRPYLTCWCPIDDVVAFTSYNFHRSGANRTPTMRRVYLPQYSAEPIVKPDGSQWGQAVPFVKDGENIYDHAADIKAREGKKQDRVSLTSGAS